MVKIKKCINDPETNYLGTEPSPKGLGFCAHAEKINTLKMGKNNKLWIVKPNINNVKRWVVLKGYFTEHNGRRPFFVNIDDKNVNIYKNGIEFDEYSLYKKIKVLSVIIGKSGTNKSFNGNTLLLELSPKKFIYIGENMYSFTIDDQIKKYYSLIGNSIPYPILLGSKNIYFMLDKKYIPLDQFPKNVDYADAYQYYYGYGKDKIKFSKYAKPMNGVKN